MSRTPNANPFVSMLKAYWPFRSLIHYKSAALPAKTFSTVGIYSTFQRRSFAFRVTLVFTS